MNNVSTRAAGLFFLGAQPGNNFRVQGYGKVFKYTLSKIYNMFFKDSEPTSLPKWLNRGMDYYTSIFELIRGFLLIVGLLRKIVLYLSRINLLIVSFGYGLIEPIWDLSHVIPRYRFTYCTFPAPAGMG